MLTVKLLSVLNRIGEVLTAELDMGRLATLVVEAGVELSNAELGAFFYHTLNEQGERLDLFAFHGTNREIFENLDFAQNTGKDILCPPDILSYMTIPVASRSGKLLGSLFFGHSEPNKFTKEHDDIIVGLSSIAAIAMDNAVLYTNAQKEIAEKVEAERALRNALTRQKMLLDELNHRVKNTLATIQSIAIQTKNASHIDNIDVFYNAFEERLMSLSRAHNLLVQGSWEGVQLKDTILSATNSMTLTDRVDVEGPAVLLSPNAAVTLNMVFHELTTNALKYGALYSTEGRIIVSWMILDHKVIIEWREEGGPKVIEPNTRGFGSKLIERGAMRELGGIAKLFFNPSGLECHMIIPMSPKVSSV